MNIMKLGFRFQRVFQESSTNCQPNVLYRKCVPKLQVFL